MSYTYNNRLRTALSLQAPDASAWGQSYGYDTARRLTSLVSPAGTFDYNYDPAKLQRVIKLSLPNSAYITNTYDNVARLLSTALENSGNTNLDSERYAYNLASQRTAETNTAGDYRNYTYDNIGELTTALGKESGGTTNRWQEQFGYNYDAAGNLNNRTNNALIQTLTLNSLNELATNKYSGTLTVAGTTTSPATNVTVNTSNASLYADATFAATNFTLANGSNTFTAIAKDSYGRIETNSITVNLPVTNSFAYDLNGNMITNGSQVLDYDDENQLIRVTVTNQFKKEYVYDGRHRLRIRKEYGWIGSAWTETNEIHYIWDGNVILQTRDINNLPVLTFTRGNDLSGSLQGAGGIDGLLAMTENSKMIIGDSSAHSYYHADGNGNITCLINAHQFIVGKYLYDSFGNPLSESGIKAFINPIWYSSQIYDPDTGFLQYLYRIYIPELDRWVNRDPIQENGGLNLFEYVANNSINRIDLLGLDEWMWIGAGPAYDNWTGGQSQNWPSGGGSMPFDLGRSIATGPFSPLDLSWNDTDWYNQNRPNSVAAAESYFKNQIESQGSCQKAQTAKIPDFVVGPGWNGPLGQSEGELGDPQQSPIEASLWIGYYSFRLGHVKCNCDGSYTADILLIDKLGVESQYGGPWTPMFTLFAGPSREYTDGHWQINGSFK